MRRLFSRAYKPKGNMIESRKTEALAAKLDHLERTSHFYTQVEMANEECLVVRELLNGSDVTFFTGNNFSQIHTQELVDQYQKTKPIMAIDLDLHITDYQRSSFRCAE